MKDEPKQPKKVKSQPTKCIKCQNVVVMEHAGDSDPKTGAWECPHCGHRYPFAHWNIRKQK